MINQRKKVTLVPIKNYCSSYSKKQFVRYLFTYPVLQTSMPLLQLSFFNFFEIQIRNGRRHFERAGTSKKIF